MKKYISLMMLSSRAVFWRLLAMMAVIFSGQWIMLFKFIAPYQEKTDSVFYTLNLSGLGSLSTYSKWTFYGVILLFCVIAARHGSGAGTQLTIKRLRISELNVVLMWGIYYTICLIFLWCAQMVNVMAMICYAETHIADFVEGEQTKLIVFYNYDFFHACLPLADGAMYVNNIVLMLGIGISLSYSSWLMRNGKIPILTFILIGSLVIVWNSSLRNGWGTMMLMVILVVSSLLYMVVLIRGDKGET